MTGVILAVVRVVQFLSIPGQPIREVSYHETEKDCMAAGKALDESTRHELTFTCQAIV